MKVVIYEKKGITCDIEKIQGYKKNLVVEVHYVVTHKRHHQCVHPSKF